MMSFIFFLEEVAGLIKKEKTSLFVTKQGYRKILLIKSICYYVLLLVTLFDVHYKKLQRTQWSTQ
jgi:hypothetical protein